MYKRVVTVQMAVQSNHLAPVILDKVPMNDSSHANIQIQNLIYETQENYFIISINEKDSVS